MYLAFAGFKSRISVLERKNETEKELYRNSLADVEKGEGYIYNMYDYQIGNLKK